MPFEGDLARWLAEARVDDAAAARSRLRWLQQQAGEEATLVGVLMDLAERGSTVIVEVSGRRPRGAVVAVAEDFCALDDANGGYLVAYAGISGVEPVERVDSVGSRPRALDMTLREALLGLLAERPHVQVIDRFGDDRRGALASVGEDVVVLRAEGTKRSVYLPLRSIAAVRIGD